MLFTAVTVWAVLSLGLMSLGVTSTAIWAAALAAGIAFFVKLVQRMLASARTIRDLRDGSFL